MLAKDGASLSHCPAVLSLQRAGGRAERLRREKAPPALVLPCLPSVQPPSRSASSAPSLTLTLSVLSHCQRQFIRNEALPHWERRPALNGPDWRVIWPHWAMPDSAPWQRPAPPFARVPCKAPSAADCGWMEEAKGCRGVERGSGRSFIMGPAAGACCTLYCKQRTNLSCKRRTDLLCKWSATLSSPPRRHWHTLRTDCHCSRQAR